MAPAHEDDAASGARRRGRRRDLSWATLFCIGSQEALAEGTSTTPWERSRSRSRRRKKRTVPVSVDEDLAGTAAHLEAMRRGSGSGTDVEESSQKRKGGLRLPGCCFSAPARAPGRKHSTIIDSSSGRNKQRHPERSQSNKDSPSEAPQIQATGGSNSNGSPDSEQPRAAPAETTRTPTIPNKTRAGVGAFGPAVGLSVVVAVTMAGLLGGRLWAVACLCAWLAALSRLRRREPTAAARDAAEEVAVGVDSTTDHKKLLVPSGAA